MSGKIGPNKSLEAPDSNGLIGDGHALGLDGAALPADADDLVIEQKNFRIRLADTESGRNSASMLINKMYAWRGYGSAHQVKASPSRITLTASDKEKVIGTVTLGIDSEEGLLADEIFKPEIDARRNAGGKVCELTKLAFDPDIRSKFALASLFHIVFIYGRRMHNCTDVFIEVNPRHRRFYETMLGFKRQCEIRTNPRVNAPAVLLWVDIGYVEEQIHKYGGTSDNPDTTRSLYPYFFSPREEAGIHGRLVSLG
ncbi:N-acyl amino acid synthase FeeM domain-containing protein [Noviherbaspirillum soli]|uniref:N-acyl amino acid synthase FeeM domain-containing protein n=1 Tax=Noviherbaspirillum soli TaxID=1064518 RepID=UPI001E3F316F|nr:N-acetyltransferase [Noviherbaspirillum soli]